MCLATELLLKVCNSEEQILALQHCFTSCTMNVISHGLYLCAGDVDLFLLTNIVKVIEDVCDDLLHLCIFISLSDTDEIIMLSLSGDHNVI